MKKIITTNEQETFNLANDLARGFSGGEIVCLKGKLGAGKTIFSKGIAAGLGYEKNVNSPTFVVMKVYNIDSNKNCIEHLVHIDAYRLQSAEEIAPLGVNEYLGKKNTITLIEWPNNIEKALPKEIINVDINILEGNKREVTIY